MFKTILFFAALATNPTLANAEPANTVRVADLDLSTVTGQARLGHRIADACGEAADVDLAGRNQVRACRADARAKAQAHEQARLARRQSAQMASGQQ